MRDYRIGSRDCINYAVTQMIAIVSTMDKDMNSISTIIIYEIDCRKRELIIENIIYKYVH